MSRRISNILSWEDGLRLYPIIKDVIKLTKKLYDGADSETRTRIRLVVGSGVLGMPAIVTLLVWNWLFVNPLGRTSGPWFGIFSPYFRNETLGFLLGLGMIILSIHYLWERIGRFIDHSISWRRRLILVNRAYAPRKNRVRTP